MAEQAGLRKVMLILQAATCVLFVLAASQVQVSAGRSTLALMKEDATQGLRVDMIHVDSLMDKNSLHTPDRLRRAAEKSMHRAQALARSWAKSTYSQTYSQSQAEIDLAPAAVYSSDNGAYLIDLALGTPPQSFSGILDTGSDLVWMQSSPCVECYKQADPLFDPSNSSTYKTLSCSDDLCSALPEPLCDANGCNYYYTYGDGSTTLGVLSSDTLTIGGSSVDTFVFGAGNTNYGNIATVGTDGIVGMGAGPLSLFSQMSSTIQHKFSYCLVTWDDAPSKSSPLFLGSSATLTGSKIVSTPFVTNPTMPTFYYLGLQGISFNGELLNIPPGTFDLQPDGSGGVVIDSGTTVTILVEAAYTPIRKAYSSVIKLPIVDGSSLGLDLCYNNSKEGKVDIPPLTFHFDRADVEMPPENIFFDIQGYLCLGVIELPPDLGVSLNIYGNFQQQNFQILYDKGSANQLSFKPGVQCETL